MSQRPKLTRKQLKNPLIPPGKVILSFAAKIVSESTDDDLREFLVNYCVDDQTFSVSEKVVPNSGFPGGRFIGTTKVTDPATGKPYKPDDVTVGKTVVVNSWQFLLAEASEGTLKTMENHPELFPRSNVSHVSETIKDALGSKLSIFDARCSELDPHGHGKITRDDFFSILHDLGVDTDEQESITIFRAFRFANSDRIRYRDFIDSL